MTPEQIALLKEEVRKSEYIGETSRDIARMLSTRPEVPNPLPTAKAPAPFTAADIKTIVSTLPEEVQVGLVDIIAEQDHSKLKDYGTFGGKNLSAIADRVIDDPNHPATVPGDSTLMSLGIRVLEWNGMTFTDSIPRGAIEDIHNG